MPLTKHDLQAVNNLLISIREEQKQQGEQLKQQGEQLKNVEIVGLQTKTAVDALAEGQKDIRRSVVKELKNHERRLSNVEQHAHSHKN